MLGLLAVASLVGCNQKYDNWADPQAVPQPATVAFGDGSVTAVAEIDLGTNEEKQIKVCEIVAPTASSESYAPVYSLVLGEKKTVLAISEEGYIAAAELQTFIEDNYGKKPVVRDIPATVTMAMSNDKSQVILTSAPFVLKAKPAAPVLYDHLYLIGAPSAWDPTETSMPFSHSAENVYDDPVFTITFPVADTIDAEIWFAFADDYTVAQNDWKQVYGCKEGNGKSLLDEWGKFARRTDLEDDGSFKVTIAAGEGTKFVKVTVNVMDASYLIEKLSFEDYIFVPGNPSWSPATAPALKHQGDGVYTGFAVVNGGFKFTRVRDWGAEYNNSSFDSASAGFDLGDGNGGNIECTDSAMYYFTVDVVNRTLIATKITRCGVIGVFNGWADDVELTWNAAELCYEGTAAVTAAGWKFRFNGAWDLNLGGNINDLVENGDNLDAAGSNIKLYPCRNASDYIYCTVE